MSDDHPGPPCDALTARPKNTIRTAGLGRREVLGDVRHCWRPLPPEFYKTNADGAFDPNTRTGGWGFVVRDTKGEVIMVGAGYTQHVASPLQAEMIAMLRGV